MKISERIALIRAGYSKDEITELIKEDSAEASAEDKAKTVPDEYKDVLVTLANEVKTLKETVQRKNVQTAEAKAPGTPEDDIVKILGSLVDPDINKEEKK